MADTDVNVHVLPLEEWLGKPAIEVYAKLQTGDPLHLQETCSRLLDERALLLDPTRVFEEAKREVAFDVERSKLEDIHPEWLDEVVDRAIDRLLRTDLIGALNSSHYEVSEHQYIGDLFLLPEDGDYRLASVDYHGLPLWIRRAFFALVMRDVPPDECVERGLGSRPELRHAVWSVFVAVGVVTQAEYDECAKKFKS